MTGVRTALPTDGRSRVLGLPRSRRSKPAAALLLMGSAVLLAGCGTGTSSEPAPSHRQEAAAAAALTTSSPSPTVIRSTPSANAPTAEESATATASASASAPGSVVPPPRLAVTCPSSTGAAVVFGHDVTAQSPYSVAIDYGDGKSYSNDDAHLSAVFSHTYQRSGTFTVTARVIDAAGRLVDSTCTVTSTKRVAAATSDIIGHGASGSSSGGGGDYYTNSDGDEVHRPEQASSVPDGASAQCHDGSYSFSQHRSGTCSHHGGVASWL